MGTVKKYFGSLRNLLFVLLAVTVGIFIGYIMHGGDAGSGQPVIPTAMPGMVQTAPEEQADSLQPAVQQKQTLYVCPMNCVPPMTQPGKCPVCGMELVAATADSHDHKDGLPRVHLGAESVKAAGIQVAPVVKMAVAAEVRLFGKIEYDPAFEYKVTAFAPGVIDEIYVKRAGQTVDAGDALYDMYSVELYFLEQQLFAALEKLPGFKANRPAVGQRYKQWVKDWMWKPTGAPLTKRVRPRMSVTPPTEPEVEREISHEEEQAITEEVRKIRREIGSLGLTEAEVDQIINRGWPTGIKTELTPRAGIVLKQDAFASMYLNTGDSVFTIADPSHVWALFDAFASDFPWIKPGQRTEFRCDGYPGEIFTGEVVYIDPSFDEKTGTTRVGVICSSDLGKLKPGMLVRGTMYASLTQGFRVNPRANGQQEKWLAIPETAPLITGKRAVVYVEVAGNPGRMKAGKCFWVPGPRDTT